MHIHDSVATPKDFSNDLSLNVTSVQSKRGEHEVGHHHVFIIFKPWAAAMEVLFTGYIFYNNSVDAAGAAKLAALYILANTDVTVDHITKAGRP